MNSLMSRLTEIVSLLCMTKLISKIMWLKPEILSTYRLCFKNFEINLLVIHVYNFRLHHTIFRNSVFKIILKVKIIIP